MKTRIFFLVVILLLVSGCADVATCVTATPDYGFWGGLWHGMVAGFAFIGSLFDEEIAVYAVNNNGHWYDLGFVLGIGALGSVIKLMASLFVSAKD